jgi:hypothetical protein
MIGSTSCDGLGKRLSYDVGQPAKARTTKLRSTHYPFRHHFIGDRGRFDRKIGPEMAAEYKNTGLLLVASLIDEKNGICGSKRALMDWGSNADTFSGRWIKAVDEIVQTAEALVS